MARRDPLERGILEAQSAPKAPAENADIFSALETGQGRPVAGEEGAPLCRPPRAAGGPLCRPDDEARRRCVDGLRAATKLGGGELNNLTADLYVCIRVYRDHVSSEAQECAGQVAEWYASVADALRRLAEIAEKAPANISLFSVGLDPHELRHRAMGARADAQLHALNNPKHRPLYKGECRDYLARKAKEAIERHCRQLTKPNLRRAVAAVLDAAEAPYPNFKKDAAKFDKVFGVPLAPSDDELKARAAVIAERIGDRLI